jgi:hypothetical protein
MPAQTTSAVRATLLAMLAMWAVLWATPAAHGAIYWGSESYRSGIGRASLDGTKVTNPFIAPADGTYTFIRGVASDGTHLYWGDNNPNSTTGFAPTWIGRSAIDGSAITRPFTASTGQSITGMAVSATHIYWTSGALDTSGVGRTPIGGGGQYESFESVFGAPNPHTCGVAVDDKYVYFANRTTYSIGRAALATFGQPDKVEGEFIKLPVGWDPCGVAVDDTHIYWGVYETETPGNYPVAGTVIGRANKDGSGQVDAMWGGGNRVSGVAVQGDFIYWSNYGSGMPGTGSIGRATKTGGGTDPSFVGGLTMPYGVAVDSSGPAPAPPTPDAPPQAPPPPLIVGVNPGNTGSGPSSASVPCSVPTACQGPRPDFSRVWVTRQVFAPAAWNTPVAIGAKATARTAVARGTTFNYIIDRAATVRIAIQRAAGSGRKVGTKCHTPTTRLKHRPPCTRFATVATLTRAAQQGQNALPFSGRIRNKPLKPSRYQAVFVARSGTAMSVAQTVAFRIAAG